jgi:hypothetical protein
MMATGSSKLDEVSAANNWTKLTAAMQPLDKESVKWLRESGLPGTDCLPEASLSKIDEWPEEARVLFLKALCGDWDWANGNQPSASTSTP